MKKQKIMLLVVVVLLLVLIGAYFGLTKYNEAQEEKEAAEEAAETTDVFTMETDDVYSISIVDSSDTPIALHFDGTNWLLDSDETVDIDEDVVNDILSDLCNITATEIITDGDASDYGVDDPSYEFTVSDSDGNTTKISFGIQNSITDEYYLILNDDTSIIYVNDGSLISTCNNSISSLVVTSDDSTEEESDVSTDTTDSSDSTESDETEDDTTTGN